MRTIIAYGNCQVGMLRQTMAWFEPIKQHYDTRYVMSFDHPTSPQQQLPDEDIRQCCLLLEQIEGNMRLPTWLQDRLPEDVPVIRFPPLDFNLLWPLNFKDPRNVPEPPEYPFGQFPYGDRVVVELLRRGLTGDALWAAYLEESPSRIPDLERLRELEWRRLVARDEHADVKLADLIMDNFTSQPLFWTINHPTGWLLGQAFTRIMRCVWKELHLAGDPEPRVMAGFRNLEPFGHQHVPIRPDVAQRLGLAWWEPTRTYRHADGSMLRYEEYMQRYINFKPAFDDNQSVTAEEKRPAPSVTTVSEHI